MASQINPNNINGSYPVAGIDNSSQGFRTNFTNTASNFTFAANEISDLQSKAVLKAALTGETLDNDMSGTLLQNAQIQGFTATAVSLGTVIGTVTIGYTSGQLQTLTTAGNISLLFGGWPAAGIEGWVTVEITVASAAHTVTLPTAVSVGSVGITGLNPATNTITFAAAGTYSFTFTTSSQGAAVTITDNNTLLREFNASTELLTSAAAASLAVCSSYFSTAGASTATLAAGVEGQVKTFAQVAAAGAMVITVAAAGWKSGGSGTITMSTVGATATLKVINGAWFVIGANGAIFA